VSRVRRLLEVVRYFLWLGISGFGVPVALCRLPEQDLRERRGWLDKTPDARCDRGLQNNARPLAMQVAIFVGYLRCGFLGEWASG
jgi:chromate transporter